jgi:hypothetical protein
MKRAGREAEAAVRSAAKGRSAARVAGVGGTVVNLARIWKGVPCDKTEESRTTMTRRCQSVDWLRRPRHRRKLVGLDRSGMSPGGRSSSIGPLYPEGRAAPRFDPRPPAWRLTNSIGRPNSVVCIELLSSILLLHKSNPIVQPLSPIVSDFSSPFRNPHS